MKDDDPNKLFKALAKLRGIKANIRTDRHEVQEKYVHEYNDTVSHIASSLQDDLDTFIVPTSEIKPTMLSYIPGKETNYSSDKWCETQLLLTKLDSLISYMEMLLAREEPKKPMGFSTND